MSAIFNQASEVTSVGDVPLVMPSRELNLEPEWQAKQKFLL